MRKDEKSERSRTAILQVALELFSSRGYRGTSVRDIAEAAGLSTGNVYHHFPDKETIFQTLLQEFWDAVDTPDFPIIAALSSGVFPDNLEAIGRATEGVMQTWRRHIFLIYVDVIEFDGSHIRKFYAGMAQRASDLLGNHPHRGRIEARLRPEISPVSAVLIATRLFLSYFTIDVLFGVKDHFGKGTEEILAEMSDVLRRGIVAEAKREA